jgi:hypothetical protein
MQSRNLSLLIKSLAVALTGLGFSAAAFGQSNIIANQLGTADDGMICRSGYTASFDGSRFKCSKAQVITVALTCTNPTFPTYVTRASGAPGTPNGRDICTRSTVSVGSTDSVVNLVQGQDYVLAAVDNTTVTNRTNTADQNEAAALGLSVSEVDTNAGTPSIVLNGGVGSKDNATVQLTHFTFAIKTGGIIVGGPFPAR